jgi:hypothetical protein
MTPAITTSPGQPTPPDRIYGWLDTQMSVARHYGGITYQGVSYVIDMQDPEQPLVRQDVLVSEIRAAKKALLDKSKAAVERAAGAQVVLI